MKNLKEIWNSFNFFRQCKRYNVSLLQCPQFLFLLMGAVIIISIVATNIVARLFVGPEIVALIVLAVTAVLFIISYAVVSSFERIAQSSQAKSDFISIMSHRLRSPLSSIKWHLELLNDEKQILNKEITTLFSELEKQNEKMIRLINNLLELNKIDDNSLILKPSHFSLKELVEEVVQIHKKSLDGFGVPIFISAPDSLPNVFADKMKIKNVIFHLLDNAIRYSRKDGKISVTLEQLPKYLRCSVIDEGTGILENEKGKIFSKFFRSSGKLRYQTEGTGIGLFIAKKIIDRSKGKIDFISIEGRGSTFWFILPIGKKSYDK